MSRALLGAAGPSSLWGRFPKQWGPSFASSSELVHLLIFAPRFEHLDKLQRAVSDLSPCPSLKRLPLLDPVLRNVVAQDLRFVQGELVLLLFVSHCPWASETAIGEWTDSRLPDAFVKFRPEFCWCGSILLYCLSNPKGGSHTTCQAAVTMKATQGSLAQPAVWARTSHCVGWFNFLTETNPIVLRLEMHLGHCIRALVPLHGCLLYCSEPACNQDFSESAEMSFCEFPLTGRCSFCPRSKKIALSFYLQGPNDFHLFREKREKSEKGHCFRSKVSSWLNPHTVEFSEKITTVSDVPF